MFIFNLYAFILLTSPIVPGINYFVDNSFSSSVTGSKKASMYFLGAHGTVSGFALSAAHTHVPLNSSKLVPQFHIRVRACFTSTSK